MFRKTKSPQPEPSYFTATPATVAYHTNKEKELESDAIFHRDHHAEQSKKKFVLNPQQVYHKKQIKKANQNLSYHRNNVDQLSISELTGAFKITKSQSGNHSHYQASTLAGDKVPAPQQ